MLRSYSGIDNLYVTSNRRLKVQEMLLADESILENILITNIIWQSDDAAPIPLFPYLGSHSSPHTRLESLNHNWGKIEPCTEFLKQNKLA